MSFIREEHILIFDALALHRLNDLLRLGLLDTRIIGSLCNQERNFDLVNLEEGRTGLQKLLLSVRVANTFMERCQERGPIWGDRPNERNKIGGPDNIHCA